MMFLGMSDGSVQVPSGRWKAKWEFTATSPVAAVHRMVDVLPDECDEICMPLPLYTEMTKGIADESVLVLDHAPKPRRVIKVTVAPSFRDLQAIDAWAGEVWLARCIFPGERLYPIFQTEGAEAIADDYRSPLLSQDVAHPGSSGRVGE